MSALRELLLRRDAELVERLVSREPALRDPVAALAPLARSSGEPLLPALLARGKTTAESLAAARAGWRPAPVAWRGLEVLGEAGRGEHGVVLWARRARDGAELALKVLRTPSGGAGPEATARFTREARLLARLDHPGIVRLHDAGDDQGTPFLLTDAVLGGSLADLGPVPARRALAISAAIGDALAHAHAAGVVHRDLKPTNVLRDGDRPRLADFGLAKALDGGASLTGSHALLGTLHYAAPEQLVVAGRVDARADVFALAALVWTLLAGAPPFAQARTFGAYLQRAREGPGTLGPRLDLSPGQLALLDAVLAESLRVDPTARLDLPALRRGLADALAG